MKPVNSTTHAYQQWQSIDVALIYQKKKGLLYLFCFSHVPQVAKHLHTRHVQPTAHGLYIILAQLACMVFSIHHKT